MNSPRVRSLQQERNWIRSANPRQKDEYRRMTYSYCIEYKCLCESPEPSLRMLQRQQGP